MTVLRKFPCEGIGLYSLPGQNRGKLCLVGGRDHLIAASGAAAELVFRGEYDHLRSDDDRQMFSEPGAPSWDHTVDSAKRILTLKLDRLQALVSKMMDIREQTPHYSALPMRQILGLPGVFLELLSGETISRIVVSLSQ